MRKEQVNILEIKWEFSGNQTHELNSGNDYDIYQVYGTHAVLGSDCLLYIGRATDQTFNRRFQQHEDWIVKEHSNLTFYFGRLGGISKPTDEQWTVEIDKAERLLIYNCSPPYNTQSISSYGDIKNTIVLNFGKRHRLPFEVSSFRNDTDFWQEGKWRVYREN